MLYHLLYEELFPFFSPLRVFSYITVRTAFASMTALGLGLLLGPWLIRTLRDFQIGQFIREEGPKNHQAKAGTPTMGGLLICISIVLPTLLWSDLGNVYIWIALLGLVGFAGIGFADDYTKIKRGKNLGLTVRAKIALQVVVTLLIGSILAWLYSSGDYDARVVFPFFKNLTPDLIFESLLEIRVGGQGNLTCRRELIAFSPYAKMRKQRFEQAEAVEVRGSPSLASAIVRKELLPEDGVVTEIAVSHAFVDDHEVVRSERRVVGVHQALPRLGVRVVRPSA